MLIFKTSRVHFRPHLSRRELIRDARQVNSATAIMCGLPLFASFSCEQAFSSFFVRAMRQLRRSLEYVPIIWRDTAIRARKVVLAMPPCRSRIPREIHEPTPGFSTLRDCVIFLHAPSAFIKSLFITNVESGTVS